MVDHVVIDRDRLAAALAKGDGLDWDETCAYEADPECRQGCGSSTCIAAHYEDHDPDVARASYRRYAETAIQMIGGGA
ncbi:hypothetical protein CA223_06750 [Sphingomonas koreensis]|uniref:Uncharacterized protein n=1 Tax=Sphingomonas koreensis TaxID=93064 RepID=A0A1L6J7R9_9SPHN|nr:hypothetical protein [Sphingomonas koreensis]APR52002.1 hypothetical protein BRX40_05730 [Sphingomonas koreensis]RSU22806.1 hypothetical protein CA224_05350 [Sphingomonas koreensis]RSU30720.1 hypothetical protein CA222_01195 [Sphingomonas koreensis]RSU31815.1 hypothetical protein CA225_00275 [Sphingomonas koreensis]RSU39264.1 hypothetical protein BRX39_01255 [Sphingomonas koreensis]